MFTVSALLLFILVMLGGSWMMMQLVNGRPVPPLVKHGHGVAAAVGLALLVKAAVDTRSMTLFLSAAILLSGFLGGVLLFGFVFRGRRTPGALVVMHASLGTLGVLLLAYAAVG